MKLPLRRVVPLAGVIVALLPVAAHASDSFSVDQDSAHASGVLTWYNRSLGVKGTASYTDDNGKCAKVTLKFWLDEAGTISWSGAPTRTVTACPVKDFQFTELGPQGGLRSVDICVTDTFRGLTTCLHKTRSQDVSGGTDLPVTIPDYEVGL